MHSCTMHTVPLITIRHTSQNNSGLESKVRIATVFLQIQQFSHMSPVAQEQGLGLAK